MTGKRSKAKHRQHAVIAGLGVLVIVAGFLVMNFSSTAPERIAMPAPAPVPPATIDVQVQTSLTRDELVASTGTFAGLFTQHAPYRDSELDAYQQMSGITPNMITMFNKWDTDFRSDAADKAYARGAVPMVSWEPWASGSSNNDPAYSHQQIISGVYDEYITRYAQSVASYEKTIAIRFAHEMNGGWYPWGANVGSNTSATYAQMWQHVHDIFTANGADNVAWVWSTNVIRAVPDTKVPLVGLYPGDAYVDLVGMTAYAVGEASAAELYDPTVHVIQQFTQKRFLMTETGAKPYAGKTGFINSFFDYMAQPHIFGFVWFETDKDTGGNDYWRVEDSAENVAAYRAGGLKLVMAPSSKSTTVTVLESEGYTPAPNDIAVIPGGP
jgi:hypothetical protein